MIISTGTERGDGRFRGLWYRGNFEKVYLLNFKFIRLGRKEKVLIFNFRGLSELLF